MTSQTQYEANDEIGADELLSTREALYRVVSGTRQPVSWMLMTCQVNGRSTSDQHSWANR